MTRPGEPFEVEGAGAPWLELAPPEPGPPKPAHPGRAAAVAAGAVAVVAALGLPLGLLWSALAPDVPVLVTDGGLVFAEAQPEQPIAGDGWFVLLAVPFGVLVAVAGWALRPVRGTTGLLALTAGALAAGPLAWWLGRQVGLADFEAAAGAAAPGSVLGHPADLRVVEADWWPPMLSGVPVVPALAVAVTYTVLAAWSRYPSLRP